MPLTFSPRANTASPAALMTNVNVRLVFIEIFASNRFMPPPADKSPFSSQLGKRLFFNIVLATQASMCGWHSRQGNQ